MKLKIALLLSFLAILFSFQSLAQNITVTGKITNRSTGEVLPNATVSVKGSSTSTLTNEQGVFRINVPGPGSVLLVTYSGMLDFQVPVTAGTTNYDIQLEPRSNAMNEVVVVGYGTQRRATLTGAISSVKAKDLENIPNGRIEQALQGRVSGVTILQNSGQPGEGSTIRVRGITTFNNNNPLWVVDGVVVDAGGIGYLNQSDIESIEVLKDAASSAIYGTRAATGVILVTTKKGRSGKPVVSYNGYFGVSAPEHVLNLLNATQYAVLRNESSVAGGGNVLFPDVSSLGVGTDWQKAIFNNSAQRYLHEISLSGGNDRSTFYFSAGMQSNEGIVATDISNSNKQNLRFNSTHKLSNVFTFGQTLGYTHQKNMGLGNTNSEYGGPLSSAINLDPITPLVVDPSLLASLPNASIYNNNGVIKDPNGNYYGISNYVG
ncbi:MAG: TonB-dependent receptor plug domain-containing protein, partial [Candidatus Dadabacteria bacterium]